MLSHRSIARLVDDTVLAKLQRTAPGIIIVEQNVHLSFIVYEVAG